MSNIYIQEPPPEGKVCLETTAGDIDIELWSREAPKACRNFVQLCMEGYYDGTIFHRLVKGFIVQGGDPTGSGTGGNSIWGKPFKDEFHSRLRFVRRGLVAMANAGKDDNGSQFFFTLGQTPELQNKHTIFAKVGGNTIYNMLKLEDGVTDGDEKPLYPHKIIKTRILSNPFNDIVPRETIKRAKDEKKDKKSKSAATKNYKLLSFGEEAEEDEEEVDEANRQYSGKGKSSHDLANDPKLSAEPAVESSSQQLKSKRNLSHGSSSESENESTKSKEDMNLKKDRSSNSGDDNEKNEETIQKEKEIQSVRDKLKRKEEKVPKKDFKLVESSDKKIESKRKVEEDSDEEYYLGKSEKMKQKRKVEELRKEYKELRRSIKREEQEEKKEAAVVAKEEESKAAKLAADNNVIKEFMDEQEKYKAVKAKAPKKEDRESITLALLAKFKNKIESAKETFGESELPPSSSSTGNDKTDKAIDDEEDDDKPDDISWLARKLHYDNKDEVLAKDANTKSDDWFDIYDPRNALTKRRREQSKDNSKEKKRSRINN